VTNENEAAASFCQQLAARVQDILCNFYSINNDKVATSLASTEATEK
jgi:hypothetical protein